MIFDQLDLRQSEIASGLRFPEGPIWLPDNSVLVVEIEGKRLTRVSPTGVKTTIARLEGGPNGAALGPDGACYICNNGGFSWHEDDHGLRPSGSAPDYSGGWIERVDLSTGAVTRIHEKGSAGKLRGPNDLVFDRSGGFWFTDHGKARENDMDRGSVYYATMDGTTIRRVIHPLLTPNGIGLSPDGRRLYVAETQTGRLWAFDVISPGEIARRPWPSPHGGELVVNLGDYCLCDSLAVDSHGWIWIATLMKGGLSVVSPDGKRGYHIPAADRFTTNVCFAGERQQTAIVTLSQTGRLASFEIENCMDRR